MSDILRDPRDLWCPKLPGKVIGQEEAAERLA